MEIFGLEHILFMSILVILMGLSIFFIVKFVPKNKLFIPIKITAFIGLVLIIIYRIVVANSRSATFIDFLPDTFCSMMGFILPIVVLIFKPNSKIFQYAIFAGMIGGLLTFVYPDFFIYFDNIFNIHLFTGYLYHALMLYMFLLSIISKYFVPTFKNWCSLPIGLAFMVVVGIYGNSVLNQSNNMFLNEPLLTGTIFTWYNVGILFLILYTLIIQIYEMLTLKPNEWSVVKFWKILVNKFNKKKQSSKNQEKDENNQVSKTEN